MKIVILNESFISDSQISELKKHGEVESYEVTSTEQEAIERVRGADILIVDEYIFPLFNKVLDTAVELKLIILNSTACVNIDLNYLKRRNIGLCECPNYSSDSVAEICFYYMLSLSRNTLSAYNDNQEAPFEILPDDLSHRKYVGANMFGKTVGILGTGNIGKKVAQIGKGFGMKTLGFNKSGVSVEGIKIVDIDTIVEQSDFLIITLPLNTETEKLLDKNKIQKLKKGVVIVNISSNDILDEEALVESIQDGRVRGYGLDNFTNKDKSHFFYNSDKVLILPHLGFFTQESLDMIGVRIMEAFNGYINGDNTHRII